MQAAIFDAPYQMHVGDWETPQPETGEVLVAVEAVGICAGDLYIYQGINPYARYPIVGGHEIAGRVSGIGAGVEGLKIGTPVVVEPFLGCGQCYPCRVGKSNCCARLQIIGVHRAGGFAEFVAAPASHVHPIPAGLSLTLASFAEPVAIAVHACRRADITAGEEVLILGCGPIGLALIETVRALGAHPVAVDTVPARREMAVRLGAEVLPAGDGLLGAVQARTGGEGMPVVIEATGNIQVMEQTVDLVAAGGRIVIVGLAKSGHTVAFPGLDWTRKELTVLGSRASVGCFPQALELLAAGAITYASAATEFDLWDAPRVFAEIIRDPTAFHKGILVHAAE